jgi:hypothetical protein
VIWDEWTMSGTPIADYLQEAIVSDEKHGITVERDEDFGLLATQL